MTLRLIRLPEVVRKVGLSRASIYKAIQAGTFPQSIRVGLRAVAWTEESVDNWIKSTIKHVNNLKRK